MTLTKDDLQAIGEAVRPIVKEEMSTAEKRIVAEMGNRFTEQNEHISKTAKATLEEVYKHHPTREEFEELRTEVQDMQERLKQLEQAHPTTS